MENGVAIDGIQVEARHTIALADDAGKTSPVDLCQVVLTFQGTPAITILLPYPIVGTLADYFFRIAEAAPRQDPMALPSPILVQVAPGLAKQITFRYAELMLGGTE